MTIVSFIKNSISCVYILYIVIFEGSLYASQLQGLEYCDTLTPAKASQMFQASYELQKDTGIEAPSPLRALQKTVPIIKTIKAEREQLLKQKDQLEKEIIVLNEQIKNKDQQFQTFQESILRLQEESAAKDGKLIQKQETIRQLEDSFLQSTNEILSLSQEKDLLTKNIKTLDLDIQELTLRHIEKEKIIVSELIHQKKENSDLVNCISGKELHLREVKDQAAKTNEQISELKNKNIYLQAEIDLLKRQNTSLEDQIKTLTHLDSCIPEKEKEILELRKENENLNRIKAGLELSLELAREQSQLWQKNINEISKELAESKLFITDQAQKNLDLQTQNNEKLQLIEHRLIMQEVTNQELNKREEILTTENQGLRKDIANKDWEIENLNLKNQQLENHISTLIHKTQLLDLQLQKLTMPPVATYGNGIVTNREEPTQEQAPLLAKEKTNGGCCIIS